MVVAIVCLVLSTIPISANATPDAAVVESCCNITDCSARTAQPVLRDATGEILSLATVNQMVFISTSIANCSDEPIRFVAIIEARSEENVTVYLNFQTGELNGRAASQIGLSWSPEHAGNYELRTFVISDLIEPQIESQINTNEIIVS